MTSTRKNALAKLHAETTTTLYDTACRAVAEARSVDEVLDIRDASIAMKAYARQANNRDMEADAIEIRMRAMRRMDQMRQAQKASIGLARAGRHKKIGLPENPIPTLAEVGIDKNLAHEGRKLGALSEQEFEQKVVEARDAVTTAVAKVVKSIVVDHRINRGPQEYILLETYDGETVQYPKPKNLPKLIRQTNKAISWAAWSTNPITGCLHDCIGYCYARAEATTNPNLKKYYPAAFKPTLHPERLDAFANTPVPPEAADNPWERMVFVGSMTDMFGKWVPLRWIEPIFAACRANPQWIPLFLTKFPQRYVELASALSPEWWLGTTVDRQYRVKIAETAFGKIRHLPNTKWLSFEPLLERLQFPDGFFSLFDLVVIGAQTATTQPEGPMPAIAPQLDWVIDIIVQARKAGCAVWCKENLLGVPNPDSPGMILPQEMPRKFLERLEKPQ